MEIKKSQVENNNEQIYRILIVDDEKNELSSLFLTLKYANEFKSDIKLVDDPETAMEKLAKDKFDLVLSDFNMSRMNGLDFLNKVKEVYPDILRMLITASSDYEVAKDAINNAQIDNFIEKPWYNDELRKVIHQALKQKAEKKYKGTIKVDDTDEALQVIKVAQNNIFYFGNIHRTKHKVVLEFISADEFNKFYHSIKQMKNINIEDMVISDNEYIIKLTVR